jgi:glycosyl transferase cpsJ(V)
MKLSIIIPVYNTEQTLGRCINSVLQSSLNNFEIILINDGSTDNSANICESYKNNYPQQIQVIHQKNQGLSAARNAGLDISKGQYVTFIDSDDYISKDLYCHLLEQLNVNHNIDLLEYSLVKEAQNNTEILFNFKDSIYRNHRSYWIKTHAYTHAFAWNKIYKRELFKDLRYPIGKKFEDVWLLPRIIQKCQTIATTSCGYYHYDYNPHGITATADGMALQDLLNAHLKVFEQYQNADYYLSLLNIQIDVFNRLKTPILLPYKRYWTNFKLVLVSCLGVKTTCRIMNQLYKWRQRNR